MVYYNLSLIHYRLATSSTHHPDGFDMESLQGCRYSGYGGVTSLPQLFAGGKVSQTEIDHS